MKRKIIRIDEDKCTGCGLCIPNCAEGSLEIRDGKAVLVKEALCDGLGACLGHCPEDALLIEEREAEAFDEELVEKRLEELGERKVQPLAPPSRGCPSAQAHALRAPGKGPVPAGPSPDVDVTPSELTHWPVQLGLIAPTAPFLRDTDLILAADCAPFAYPNFHRDFLKGRSVAVACPKLDNANAHFQKLVQVFRDAGLRSVTVVRMEVPCCGGLSGMAAEAVRESGRELPLREVVIGRDGSILGEKLLPAAAAG